MDHQSWKLKSSSAYPATFALNFLRLLTNNFFFSKVSLDDAFEFQTLKKHLILRDDLTITDMVEIFYGHNSGSNVILVTSPARFSNVEFFKKKPAAYRVKLLLREVEGTERTSCAPEYRVAIPVLVQFLTILSFLMIIYFY